MRLVTFPPDVLSYIAQADILNQLWIEATLPDHLLEDLLDQPIERGVLETALPCLGERRTDRESDNDVVGVLRCAVSSLSSASEHLPCETWSRLRGKV